MRPGLIIVSNRLPVSVKKTDGQLEFFQSIGGLATGLSSYVNDRRNVWVGWPGIASDELTDSDKQVITAELGKQNCRPVFLSQRQIDDFYNGYSNAVLWPLFHNLPMQRTTEEVHERWWRAYRKVNTEFSEAVLSVAEAKSQIWVHDYQLLLLPGLLRAEQPETNIGFFLHIPFPDSKTFTRLPESKKLLSGMLHADLIGFHTTGYVHNFMDNCSTADVGLVGETQIVMPGHAVRVANFPMGIDYEKYAAARKNAAVKQAVKLYKRRYKRQKLIVAIDRLDPSKGLVERLKAYREFLEHNPGQRGKVTFAMVAAPSRTDVAAYRNLAKRLDVLVAEINATYGTAKWQPVDYIHELLPFAEVSALFAVADVAFIAPLRDGMNLAAKEFVASNKRSGVLILSETAGAATELRDALLVNPKQPATVVDALQQALTMPRRELRKRLKRMQQHLSTNTVQVWATNFVDSLQQPIPVPRLRTPTLRGKLEADLLDTYAATKRRLLLLDYDGTLVPFSRQYDNAKPPHSLLKLLQLLIDNEQTDVVLVSGRSAADLQTWFGHLAMGLISEHGAGTKRAGGNWHTIDRSETRWKRAVVPILEKYTKLTPNARIEAKPHSLVWHYRAAPPYYAQKYAVTIKKVLKPLLKSYGLQIFQGNKILEIKDPTISKGSAIQPWLKKRYDIILALGDDFTDEDLFRALPDTAYTIKVGRGSTAAQFRLNDVDDTLTLLKKVSKLN